MVMITRTKLMGDAVDTGKILADTVVPADIDETVPYTWTAAHSFTVSGGTAITLGTSTTGILASGNFTDAIKISGTTITDGIEISSACSGACINISGTTAARVILLTTYGTGYVCTSTRNYPIGLFARLSADEDITAEIRTTLSRLRVDAGVQIGSNDNWGQGINALKGHLAFYGGTTTNTYCWENAAVYGHLQADGVSSVNFKGGSVAACFFGHLGLLSSASGNTTIDATAVVAGVAINSGSHTNMTVNGNYVGYYLYMDAASQEVFTEGFLIDDDVTTTAIKIGNATTGISLDGDFTDGIKIASGNTIVDGLEIANNCTNAINISGTTTGAGILVSGSNKIVFYDAAMYIRASADGHLEIVSDDTITLSSPGHGGIVFGGETDWGTGATGYNIDGTGWDWVTQTVGYVSSGALAAACAASYLALTVTATSHTTASSFFGLWSELYFVTGVNLTGAANAASVWGQIEGVGTLVSPDSGDFVAAGYFNMKTGGQLTLTAGSSVNGVRVKGEINSTTGTGILAAFECLAVTTDWAYGLYMRNITTGIDIGDCTTGINLSGTMTTGIEFANATITVDSGRANAFWSIGDYAGAKTVSLSDNFLATQINLTNDTNPGSTKKLDLIYLKAATGGTAQANARLKGLESYIVVGAAVHDCHCIYGELYYDSSYTGAGVDNEGFGGAFTVDTDNCASTPTGLLYGIKARIKGGSLNTGGFAHCAAFFVTENSTFTNTRFTNLSGSTITNMVDMNQAGTCTNAFALNGAFTVFCDFSSASGCCTTSGSAATSWGGRFEVVLSDGTTGWVNVYTTSNE